MNYGTPSAHGTPRSGTSGIPATPVHHRADINTDRHLRQINIETGVSLILFLKILYALTLVIRSDSVSENSLYIYLYVLQF